ncbi:hypothetical protein [Lacticaseibacillus parakribbianus]|uniref:hypothetical protein n=1 Tax=Lacticaseibacillus parakribbianus TaxID=2970927 RepID=UPI0021CB74B7|nr:hypothetical protein [Lacticaseibacillus parakribbianus]
MTHFSKLAVLGAAAMATLVLAGCGKTLTTTKTSYKQSGMVAVIKGEAKGAKTVRYTGAVKPGTVKVNSDAFVITVPMTASEQTVTLKAGDLTHKVTVHAAKVLGDYQKIQKAYNQAVIATALPKDIQKQLKAATDAKKTDVTKLTPTQQAAVETQRQNVAAAMARAKVATKDEQLPASVEGLKQVLKGNGGTVRMNVQDGQVLGITDIVPLKALKDKAAQTAFGTQFALLASATGAEAKTVLSKFNQATKDADGSATTIATITSNGVKFNVGFSTSDLYVYITK